MKLLAFIPLFFLSSAFAESKLFCERNRIDILSLMEKTDARIDFKNTGGIGNRGVCWWHSRLQRSSFFLARFEPNKTRPNGNQVREIISSLRNMNKVVTIPGFRSFNEFSKAHKKEIQASLDDWQVFDGVFNFQWLRGISGRSALPPNEMQKRMEEVYQSFRQSPAGMWIMAQIQGITSHSFLIIRMERVNGGFDLDLIDSNHPLITVRSSYQHGDQFLVTNKKSGEFVPYVGFQEDFKKISKSLSSHCRNKSLELLEDFQNIPGGEVELERWDELVEETLN